MSARMTAQRIDSFMQARVSALIKSYEQCNSATLFNSAIDYAIQCGIEGSIFLSAWREGDWHTIANEFPEYTPPEPAGVLNSQQLELKYGSLGYKNEHPKYTQLCWLEDACNELTRDSYWEWLRKELLRENNN